MFASSEHACDQWHSSRVFTFLIDSNINHVETLKVDAYAIEIVTSTIATTTNHTHTSAIDSRSNMIIANQPDLWWAQGDGGNFGTPGGWVHVFGRVRCAFFDWILHSRMLLVPTHARLKRAEWHSSRVATPLRQCKLRPNTEGAININRIIADYERTYFAYACLVKLLIFRGSAKQTG
jgi:hypothetical protein